MSIINDKIASLRKAKGVTQEELARALGVSNQAISKWESAQCCPDIQLLPLIADYFCITLDELFERTALYETERTLWVTQFYNTNVTATLNGFTVDLIPEIQKNMGEKDFLCIENHLMRENVVVENRIYWIIKDEIISFRQGDHKTLENATKKLCERGIFGHII